MPQTSTYRSAVRRISDDIKEASGLIDDPEKRIEFLVRIQENIDSLITEAEEEEEKTFDFTEEE